MKKIFTILCLMALTVGAQAQQTYTFNWNNGSASLYDANGATIKDGLHAKWVSNVSPGLTIEVIEGGNAKKLLNTNGRIIINSASETNKIQITAPDGYVVKSYTLKFTGLSADSKTITPENGGNAQTYTNNQVTVTATGIDQQSTYFTMAAASGSWVISTVQTFSIVIEEVIENAVSVTYKVVDENGTTLTTKTESVTAGTSITSLPASMQHTLFYDYSEGSYTAAEGIEATFTATLKDSAPFIFTADATSPVWYFLTLSATPNYVTYTAGGAQNVTLPTTNADDETTHWAFIGNPYAGFTIVNEAAGTSLVLGSAATAAGQNNNGGSVYATLAAAGSQANELWFPADATKKSNGANNSVVASGKKGFYLFNAQNHGLNKRNGTDNVSYWTGGYDEGSTFVATKVPGLAELIPQAEKLLSDLTAGANEVQIGYPTASALSTFQQAINDAKAATDEAAGLAALKAAIAAVKSPANTIYTPRTDVYYTITSARGSMIYEPTYAERDNDNNTDEFVYHTGNTNGTNNAGKTHINVSLNKENANHQWGFIEKDGVFYMYNVGKKQFAGIGKGTYGATWTFSNTPSSVTLDAGINNSVAPTGVRVRATSAVTGQTYSMSISPSYHGPVITYDKEGDGGIPMTFAVATTSQDQTVTDAINALLEDLQPYRDALQEVIDKANTLTFGTGLGEYTASTDFTSALTTAESQVDATNTSATKESITAARTALETAIAASLNMPTVGKFYRIKTAKAWATEKASNFNNTQPYLIGENHSTQINSTTRAAFSTTAGEDASSIWYLTTIGESPTQYLVNFSNGRPAVNNSGFLGVGKDAQFLSPHGTSIVFKAATNGEIGAYGIVFNAGGRALYTNVNLYTDAGGANGSGAGYNFELEEVPTLPVTMHDGQDGKYYATFSAPVAISSITGATAHKVKVENEKAKYSETGVEGIPAGTGVLLINETGENATLTIGDFTDAIDTDLQYIFAAETSHEGLFFGLSTENKLGFFKLMEGGETTPTTGGFKAYLNAPASAKGVELVADNETTGIENMEHGTLNMENGAVYNLQGQRVNKAQKGVFIQNGKKVVLK
ncbi:MAG: hypothetical protein II934_10005 [Prevotella sp.]|nr:hypothetical protein [Prevotella sp.]